MRPSPRRTALLDAVVNKARRHGAGLYVTWATNGRLAECSGLPSTRAGENQANRALRELARAGVISISKPIARFGPGFRGGRIRVIVVADVAPDDTVQTPAELSKPGATLSVYGRDYAIADLGFSARPDDVTRPVGALGRSPRGVGSVNGEACPTEALGRSTRNVGSVGSPSSPNTLLSTKDSIPSPFRKDAAVQRGDVRPREETKPSDWQRLALFEELAGFKIPSASRVVVRQRLAQLNDPELRRLADVYRELSAQRWVQDPARLAAWQLRNRTRWAEIRSDPKSALKAPVNVSPPQTRLETSNMPNYIRVLASTHDDHDDADDRVARKREACFMAARLLRVGGAA